MFTEERQKHVFEKVRQYFKENKSDYLHDIDHILRVIFWAKFLSDKEKANSSITIPAAILHDIGMPEHGDELHASKGAEMCRPILKDCGYSDDEIEKIAETISMHSTDDPNPPKTLESRVLFDADKLDAGGPVGLHRWFFEYAKHGYLHHDALHKILQHIEKWRTKYGDPPFFTETGKQIGKERLEYIENQCKEILRDLEKFKELFKLI
jgi:HD superfamily phosphodiesterase